MQENPLLGVFEWVVWWTLLRQAAGYTIESLVISHQSSVLLHSEGLAMEVIDDGD